MWMKGPYACMEVNSSTDLRIAFLRCENNASRLIMTRIYVQHLLVILEILKKAELSDKTPTIEYEIFKTMPDISIDYAVMEQSKKIALLPLASLSTSPLDSLTAQ